MPAVSPEPWFNQVLFYVALVTLVPLAGLTVVNLVSHPSKTLNLWSLRGAVPREVLLCGSVWMVATLLASPQHYYFCNDFEVPYCYSFLNDLFAPLYLCLMLLTHYLNFPNRCFLHSVLILLYTTYSLLPSPVTCWWVIVWSVFVFLYQTWAMCAVAKDRKERVGLLHMNYVLTVHWMLAYYSFPPATGHQWGETQSLLRESQYYLHTFLGAVLLLGVIKYTQRPAVEELQSTLP